MSCVVRRWCAWTAMPDSAQTTQAPRVESRCVHPPRQPLLEEQVEQQVGPAPQEHEEKWLSEKSSGGRAIASHPCTVLVAPPVSGTCLIVPAGHSLGPVVVSGYRPPRPRWRPQPLPVTPREPSAVSPPPLVDASARSWPAHMTTEAKCTGRTMSAGEATAQRASVLTAFEVAQSHVQPRTARSASPLESCPSWEASLWLSEEAPLSSNVPPSPSSHSSLSSSDRMM